MPPKSRSPDPKPSAFARRIYNPLGFQKAYNFILWFLFAGAFLGFTLSRLPYLNFTTLCPPTGPEGSNSAAPGECYWYTTSARYKTGIILHLASILPASLLAVLQFTPAIRRRAPTFHRVCGWTTLLLWSVSTAGALAIARRAFNGGLDTQALVGTLAVGVTACFALAVWNVKRLQIEQHRAWMLRGWFYAGCIVTARLVMVIAASIVSSAGSYSAVWPCAKIAYALRSNETMLSLYPSCGSYFDGTNPWQEAAVHADMAGKVEEVGAALNVSFGMACWVALALHAIGIEIYLHLTPKEAERLRCVSYQRQLEAGMKDPGCAGLTADRLGDSDKWIPPVKERVGSDITITGVDMVDRTPKIDHVTG